MTADDKNPLRNSENLPQPIQMQLSKYLKTFSQNFAEFLESISNLKHFERKDDHRNLCIFEVTDYERHC